NLGECALRIGDIGALEVAIGMVAPHGDVRGGSCQEEYELNLAGRRALAPGERSVDLERVGGHVIELGRVLGRGNALGEQLVDVPLDQLPVAARVARQDDAPRGEVQRMTVSCVDELERPGGS